MAKNLKNRGYKEISSELFFGDRPAIKKYRLARHAQYEVNITEEYGRPMEQAYYVYKDFFYFGFYQKAEGETYEDKWKDACEKLNCAVGDGTGKDKSCFARCLRLMKELNDVMPEKDKMSDEEITTLIDWLTFDFTYCEDDTGNIIHDEEYGYPIVNWFDELNYNYFRDKLRRYILAGQQPPYTRLFSEVMDDYCSQHPEILISKYPYLG